MEIFNRMKAKLRQGSINLGDLRRTTPISRHFGYDRGNPVDRRYVEDFLARHSGDIRGRVLEIGDNAYTMQFGGKQVELSEVLHVDPEAPNVTYVTDLTDGAGIPDGIFDCIVLTQTLHLVYEFQKAVATLDRILKPGGVLLLTVPGVSSIDKGEWGDTWFWSFTPASLRRLMKEQFGEEAVDLASYGNVLTATAFLYGLAESDLRPHEYHVTDPQYPVIVTARVVKGRAAA
jgi:SAM-dependent methyltransferase